MPDIKIGDTVNATGLSSIDADGNRIRVRDRNEITLTDNSEMGRSILKLRIEIAKNTSKQE